MSKIHDEYPVVVRSFQLSASERANRTRQFTISSRLKSTIIDMLIEAHTKLADRENALWDDFAQRFGFKDMDEVLDQGKNIEVSWASSQVHLRSRE